jgi:hypothetical protein
MDAGMATAIGSVIVALVAAFGAWASQRAAARASQLNTMTTSRVDMEREAYDRARAFDTETIRRQDTEIEELRAQIHRQDLEIEDLRARNREQATRIFRLETGRLLPEIAKQEGKTDESRTDTS